MFYSFVQATEMTTVEEPSQQIEVSEPVPKKTRMEEQESAVGSLRDEALKRKQRLIDLRKQAQTKGVCITGLAVATEGGALPMPIFRNYKPISEELKDGLLPEGDIIDRKHSHPCL